MEEEFNDIDNYIQVIYMRYGFYKKVNLLNRLAVLKSDIRIIGEFFLKYLLLIGITNVFSLSLTVIDSHDLYKELLNNIIKHLPYNINVYDLFGFIYLYFGTENTNMILVFINNEFVTDKIFSKYKINNYDFKSGNVTKKEKCNHIFNKQNSKMNEIKRDTILSLPILGNIFGFFENYDTSLFVLLFNVESEDRNGTLLTINDKDNIYKMYGYCDEKHFNTGYKSQRLEFIGDAILNMIILEYALNLNIIGICKYVKYYLISNKYYINFMDFLDEDICGKYNNLIKYTKDEDIKFCADFFESLIGTLIIQYGILGYQNILDFLSNINFFSYMTYNIIHEKKIKKYEQYIYNPSNIKSLFYNSKGGIELFDKPENINSILLLETDRYNINGEIDNYYIDIDLNSYEKISDIILERINIIEFYLNNIIFFIYNIDDIKYKLNSSYISGNIFFDVKKSNLLNLSSEYKNIYNLYTKGIVSDIDDMKYIDLSDKNLILDFKELFDIIDSNIDGLKLNSKSINFINDMNRELDYLISNTFISEYVHNVNDSKSRNIFLLNLYFYLKLSESFQ